MGNIDPDGKRDRLIYAGIFVMMFVLEILIGVFVHDSFIRPYCGDVLVVILLWAMIRIIFPRRAVWISGAVFVFALLVELSQMIPLADLLKIKNELVRILMGTSFSAGDILAYLAGCLITAGIDVFVFRKRRAGLC